ncbi:hypothetical protein HQQ94_08405 [Shewanella sp. VB17]|uniref:DUF6890 family protein n=1 Tax=Shewanella sp. VB17 TaxID=2739432 RepID=UPI001566712F|nr:hypothetical protein [Shewanella sp. VB17]NRD73264.1 hypothetical protein [Shewanella sp. VB17]
MLTIRRHLLPHEDDSEQSIARALWLHKNNIQNLEIVTANGVNRAFSGKSN